MSVKAEASITIDRSPEAVFAILTDVVHHSDWSKGAGRISNVSQNPAMLGTTWMQVSKLMGKEVEVNARVTVYEEARRFGAEVDKPFPGRMLWLVEPAAGSAQVTLSGDFEPSGFFGIAGPLLAKAIKDQFNSDLNALKAYLEASASH